MNFLSGTIYQGDWLNDKKEGKGCEYYNNNSKYEGNYFKKWFKNKFLF